MKLTNKDQQIALIQQRRLTTQITHTFHKPTNAEQRLRSSSNQTKPNKPQNLLHRITEPSKSKPHNPSQLTHEEPQTEQMKLSNTATVKPYLIPNPKPNEPPTTQFQTPRCPKLTLMCQSQTLTHQTHTLIHSNLTNQIK